MFGNKLPPFIRAQVRIFQCHRSKTQEIQIKIMKAIISEHKFDQRGREYFGKRKEANSKEDQVVYE